MKTIEVTVYCQSGQAFVFDRYADQFGHPRITFVEGRRDLPSIRCLTKNGELWLRGTDILAIQYQPITAQSGDLTH